MHDTITVTTITDNRVHRCRTKPQQLMQITMLLLLLLSLYLPAQIAADPAVIDLLMRSPPAIGSTGSAEVPSESWESGRRSRRNAEAPRDLCTMSGCQCSGHQLEMVQCNFNGSVSFSVLTISCASNWVNTFD